VGHHKEWASWSTYGSGRVPGRRRKAGEIGVGSVSGHEDAPRVCGNQGKRRPKNDSLSVRKDSDNNGEGIWVDMKNNRNS